LAQNPKSNKRIPVVVFTAICLTFFGAHAWAAAGIETASFLDIPVGARPASLGGAYTALATDAYAPVYNAGGLGVVSSPQLSGMHLSYLDALQYEFASFASPLSNSRPLGGIGASVRYSGARDFRGTDHFNNPTGDYSAHYISYALGYGHSVGDRASVGVTGKLIDAEIDDVKANSYAADIGTLYRFRENWTAALTVTDIGNHLRMLETQETIPTAFHLGTAVGLLSSWLVTLEGAFPVRDRAQFQGGTEWNVNDLFQLRAGYRTDQTRGSSDLASLSVGAGLRLWNQDFAYAWLPYGDLGSTQYFSFLLRFGPQRAQGFRLWPRET
jgi:hypothetical protein